MTANQWNDAPTFTTGAGQFVSRNDDGTLSRRNADGTSSFDVSSGMSNLGFMLQSSRDYGSSMQKGLTQGHSVLAQKREAASDASSATYSEGAAYSKPRRSRGRLAGTTGEVLVVDLADAELRKHLVGDTAISVWLHEGSGRPNRARSDEDGRRRIEVWRRAGLGAM